MLKSFTALQLFSTFGNYNGVKLIPSSKFVFALQLSKTLFMIWYLNYRMYEKNIQTILSVNVYVVLCGGGIFSGHKSFVFVD